MLSKNHNAIAFLLLLTASGLCAQNLGATRFSGSVSQSGSDSFVVANNGRQQVYQTNTIPASGLALQNADMIQTGPGNYVEVQLDPSGAMIKLAENTSVVFNDLGTSSRPALLSFLYGRMRIVNMGNKGTITVQAGNASIEISRGDMALDFAVIPGSANKQPQFQASTFSGAGQIVSSVASPGSAKIPLYEHETVIFDVTTRLAVVTRQPLNQEIAAYWNRNGFRQVGTTPQSTYLAQGGRPTLPALGTYPVGTGSVPVGGVPARPISGGQNFDSSGFSAGGTSSIPLADQMDPVSGFDFDVMNNDRATIRPKNNGILIGTILTATGILAQVVGHYNILDLDTDTADIVYTAGFAPIAFGVVTLVATYIYSYKN
ncbi:MAG: FecR domain-containing protein [Spirochaetaceae bacterium]|jgi:hypothetical protein|nr:FecR domain-containing protein [Spirochaetaceae bacterium]